MTHTTRIVVAALCLALVPSVAHAGGGDVVSSFPAPGPLTSGLGWDGSSLWVTNIRSASEGGEDRVYQLDAQTGLVDYWFDMPANDFYHGIDFGPDGIMYTDDLYSKIVVLDAQGFETDRFDAQGMTYGVSYASATDSLYQVDWLAGDKILYELDAQTGDVLSNVALDIADQQTHDTAWDGKTLWLVGSSDTIYRVDVDTGAVIDSFEGPGNPSGIAFDGSCLYISDNNTDEIFRIDHGQSDLPSCVATDPDPDPDPDPPDDVPDPMDDPPDDTPDPTDDAPDNPNDDNGAASGCAAGGNSNGSLALILLGFLFTIRRRCGSN